MDTVAKRTATRFLKAVKALEKALALKKLPEYGRVLRAVVDKVQ